MWRGGLTGNIAELVVVEHHLASIVTKHSPQIVLIPVLKKFRVGRSSHQEGFTGPVGLVDWRSASAYPKVAK